MQETIRKAVQETFEFAKSWPEKGIVNDFIPTISNIDPDLLSVCLTDMDGNTYLFGDTDYRYTLQSISKAVMLAYCLEHVPEVSRLGAVLAADGFDPVTKKQLISAKTSHTVRALIAGCGLYEQTGAYNIAAGIPAKSGSSGVIVAAARKKAGIAVFSPGLDPVGNSVRGLKALSYLSEKLDLRTM